MGKTIPPGFQRCPQCGEFNGRTEARHLSWELPADPLDTPSPATDVWDWMQDQKSEIASTIDPDQIISVTCLCRGIPCRRCGVVTVHKPGSNSYDPETNTVSHWSGMSGMMPCASCREESDRKFE
jgi:hypothetical protein